MWTYFRPLRRKIGLATLMMACLANAIWVRANLVTDLFVVINHRGCRIWEIRSSCLLLGKEDLIGDAGYGTSQFWTVCPKDFPSSKLYAKHLSPRDQEWEWRVKLFGFDFGRTRIKNRQNDIQLTLGVIPLWSIVLPLTGLSAWLLLWKPKAMDPQSASNRGPLQRS